MWSGIKGVNVIIGNESSFCGAAEGSLRAGIKQRPLLILPEQVVLSFLYPSCPFFFLSLFKPQQIVLMK